MHVKLYILKLHWTKSWNDHEKTVNKMYFQACTFSMKKFKVYSYHFLILGVNEGSNFSLFRRGDAYYICTNMFNTLILILYWVLILILNLS